MAPRRKRNRPRGVAIDVQLRIEALASEGFSGAAIDKQLQREQMDGSLKGKLPDVRTVQRIIRDYRGLDPSDPWRMGEHSGEEVRRVLALLRSVVDVDSPEPVLTNKVAKWVLWVADAAPGLEARCVLLLGRAYATYEGHCWPTRPLDLYLLHAPWSNELAYHTYTVRVGLGKIPPVPLWPVLVVGQNPQQGVFTRYLAEEEAAARENQRAAELEAREKREQGPGTGETERGQT